MTTLARSKRRRSASSRSARPVSAMLPSSSCPARTAHTQVPWTDTARLPPVEAATARADGGREVGAQLGEFGAFRVVDEGAALQDGADGGGDVGDVATAQDQGAGQPVVGVLGSSAHAASLCASMVREAALRSTKRGTRLVQQAGAVDGDGGVVGRGRTAGRLRPV
ncbi:hypothetical protein [Streptomyces sp. NBC_01294]|uniref:hypothetical protein n=1 Tax=Streptomyces sp. NBC_01294 TaxID=2903815 RepID=UPI002DDBBAA4|nr:hypothetical protein [Streptomyces sp. NBC_01294]WRZ62160.1 hypothetical protein OG534_01155 [Streptomyces sp. NBC_01294]